MSNNNNKPKRWPPPKLQLPDFSIINDGRPTIVQAYNKWYAEHIEPLGPGVEVFNDGDTTGGCDVWKDMKFSRDTHHAILIGIEPIKSPSAEEMLVELIEIWRRGSLTDCEQVVRKAEELFVVKKRGNR